MNKKGITLTEVAITLGVISISLLFGMKAFVGYFKSNVYTNEKSVETVLATGRIEEWKSVGGNNFVPGVQIPLFTTSVAANGVVSFTRSLYAVPATTSLQVDCTTDTIVTQTSGYSYVLTQGTYGDAGGGNNCWFDPGIRLPGDHTPGSIKFTITVPTSVSCTLTMNLVDLGTRYREERVIVNNIIRGSYTAAQLVPLAGQSVAVNLTSNDTSTGTINVEIEQTNTTYQVAGNTFVLDDCNDAGWTDDPPSIVLSNPITPGTPLPYTESDGQSLYVDGPGSSGQNIYRNYNTSLALVGDSIIAWVRLDADTSGGIQVWMNLPSGNSNVVTSAVSGWQQLTKVLTAADIGASIPVYIHFSQLTTPNTHDRFHLNELTLQFVTTQTNPNAVLSSFTLQSLTGFTDTTTYPPYIITSALTPSDSTPGAALGWIVTVSVSKSGSNYQPVTISNTINR